MTEKEFILHMNSQIPNPYINGHWYDSIMPNGQKVEIKRTKGKGKNTGTKYLHIRKPVHTAIYCPETGDKLYRSDTKDTYLYFRANLSTFELKEY